MKKRYEDVGGRKFSPGAFVRTIILAASVCLVFISAWMIISNVLEERRQIELRDKVLEHYTAAVAKSEEIAAVVTPTPEASVTPEIITPIPAPTVNPVFTELIAEYNNDDIVGFLSIEGTSINYPVVQAVDNDFYLDHDIYKKKSAPGWIFLDYENDITRNDPNTIIYGHNMKSDTMFHALRLYADESFYRNHKYITFNTLYEDLRWEIFSFCKTDTSFDYIRVFFPDMEIYETMLRKFKDLSIYDTEVEITGSDRILSLSTCTLGNPNARFVLSARLLQD